MTLETWLLTGERDQGRRDAVFYDLATEITHHHVRHILFVKIKLLSQAHIQGEKSWSLPFIGRMPKVLWTCFKSTTVRL